MRISTFLRRELTSYFRNIWIYTKYQLITKGVMLLIVLPLVGLGLDMLMKSFDMVAISSGDYRDVLFSAKGLGFILVFVLILVFVTLLDINSFVAISNSIKRGRVLGFREALKEGLASFRSFLSPAGLFLLVYTLLIVPLAGVGLKLSSISSIKIPNFISSVIYDNPLYLSLYLMAMVVFALLGFFLILSFHYMQLKKQGAKAAMRSSIGTVWKKKGFLIASLLIVNLLALLLTALIGSLIYYLTTRIAEGLVGEVFWSRFFLLALLLSFLELIQFFLFLMAPLQIHLLTGAYALFEGENLTETMNEDAASKKPGKNRSLRSSKLFFVFLILLLFANLSLSAFGAYYFDEIYHRSIQVEIIAHRGGGNLGVENSLEGMLEAADAGATWSEIDVMRSKDGVYLINHDKNFARLAGVKKQPSELHWKDIQEIDLKNTFQPGLPSAKVPSLEEIMDAAKGKIGLFIELKAPAADRLMVDDVVRLIKEKNMEEEAVIIALDFKLIAYLEENYPEIQSGYLYFFALGNTSKVNSDYLIMEEAMLNPGAVQRIHEEGKKAVVWTVNKFKYLKTYVDTDVDAIITDYVLDLKSELSELSKKSDIDVIWLNFKNFLEGVLN